MEEKQGGTMEGGMECDFGEKLEGQNRRMNWCHNSYREYTKPFFLTSILPDNYRLANLNISIIKLISILIPLHCILQAWGHLSFRFLNTRCKRRKDSQISSMYVA